MNRDTPQPQAPLAEQVLEAIRSVAGDGPLPLHEPRFAGNEWLYVKECIDTTFVSSVGKFVDRFELDLAKYTGAAYAVATVNGTAALHIAAMLAGVGPGDEVLMPALTFVATANAVSYCGAVPHFVDSEERTFGIDAAALRDWLAKTTEQHDGQCLNRATGRVIRAMVPMHVFGHPVDIDALLAISADFNIVMIEDAAEGLGSLYHGKAAGTFGRLGTLSFNGNKTITTGGGGAILTQDADLARRAKHLTTTAKLPHAWHYRHDEIGYNYRLPNINAALGCAQLEQMPGFIQAKRELFRRYQDAFAGVPGVTIAAEPEGCRSNYWLQTLVIDEGRAVERDEILELTNAAGCMTRPVWGLMNELPHFADCPRMDLSTARSLERRLINIPSSQGLGANW